MRKNKPEIRGTSVHIRITPELRKKINTILAAEKPKIGKLSLNALLVYLLQQGISRYEEK